MDESRQEAHLSQHLYSQVDDDNPDDHRQHLLSSACAPSTSSSSSESTTTMSHHTLVDKDGSEKPYSSSPVSSSSSSSSASSWLMGEYDTSKFNILLVSIGFMFIFTSFGTLQGYLTSLLADGAGNKSLTLVYLSVCCSVFFAPIIVKKIGYKYSLLFGSIAYVIYTFSLYYFMQSNPSHLYIPAVIVGIGASIIWVGVGGFIQEQSTHANRSLHTSLFWGIFQCSSIIGNLLAYVLYAHYLPQTMFLIFTLVASLGTTCMFLLKNTHLPSEKSTLEKTGRSASSIWMEIYTSVKLSIELLSTLPMLLLCPIFFFMGIEFAFWNGEFPQLLNVHSIGLVLLAAGVGEVLGPTTISTFSMKWGRSSVVLVFGSGVYVTGLLLAIAIKNRFAFTTDTEYGGAPIIAPIAAFAFGFADSTFNTQIYSLLGERYPNQTTQAFTVFNFVQNLGLALGFFYALSLPLHGDAGNLAQIFIQIALLIFATSCYMVVERSERIKEWVHYHDQSLARDASPEDPPQLV